MASPPRNLGSARRARSRWRAEPTNQVSRRMVAETWGRPTARARPAWSVLTQNIQAWAAITQILRDSRPRPHPAISTIDQLSNGRAMLGLGLSGPQVSEGWYGGAVRPTAGPDPEYIDIVRMALARRRSSITASASTCG